MRFRNEISFDAVTVVSSTGQKYTASIMNERDADFWIEMLQHIVDQEKMRLDYTIAPTARLTGNGPTMAQDAQKG